MQMDLGDTWKMEMNNHYYQVFLMLFLQHWWHEQDFQLKLSDTLAHILPILCQIECVLEVRILQIASQFTMLYDVSRTALRSSSWDIGS